MLICIFLNYTSYNIKRKEKYFKVRIIGHRMIYNSIIDKIKQKTLDILLCRNYNKIQKRTNVLLEEIMEIRFIIQTVLEIGVAVFIIFGLFFEQKLALAERKLFSLLRRRFRRTVIGVRCKKSKRIA